MWLLNILLSFILFSSSNAWFPISEMVTMNASEIMTAEGYPADEHKVVSADGYIISLLRIRENGKFCGKVRTPVFLVPGIFCDAINFILSGQKNSLSFILFDECYDVWIMNPRGSDNSRGHLTLDGNAESGAYWNFTNDEIGLHDISVSIDHIIETTGFSKIFYIGFSMGCSDLMVLLSTRVEYNEKIELFIALAPAVYVNHGKSDTYDSLKYFEKDYQLSNLRETIGDFRYSTLKDATFMQNQVCAPESPFQEDCMEPFYAQFGYNRHGFNKTLIPTILSHFPGPSGFKQLLRYVQISNTGNFCMYDYGPEENLIRYGQSTPPLYDLSKVTVPTRILYCEDDLVVSPVDVHRYGREISNLVSMKKVNSIIKSHQDFTLGIRSKKYVYPFILEYIKNAINSTSVTQGN